MSEMTEPKTSVIFPLGEKVMSENFKGDVWLSMLTPFGTPCPVGNVTFAPGSRNSWHKHAGGQILLVTGGRGYYQEWGKSARELRAGGVVQIPGGVKHWHGASPNSMFVHIAIEVQPEKGPPVWMESVSDEDYTKLD